MQKKNLALEGKFKRKKQTDNFQKKIYLYKFTTGHTNLTVNFSICTLNSAYH